jgi:23S rRNA (uracil1939-C5)-methyltransferase
VSAETVTIEALGAQGDGVARTADGPVFVPFTLPGELASVAREKNHGTLIALKRTAPERIEPQCRHFGPDGVNGACGGCLLQHYDRAAYDDWKRGLVVQALRDQRIEADVAALEPCQPGERRRLTLTAKRSDQGLLLGFSAARSNSIVSISECPVATPAIADKLDIIRKVAGALATGSKPFRLTVTATASGLDIALTDAAKLSDRQRLMAIETVLALPDIARVTLGGEILVEPRRPVIHLGKVPIALPPGAFLQASARAEGIMTGLATRHLSGAKRVADLFSGCGTFALRLAAQSAVHAVESDRPALAALEEGFRRIQGLKPVTTERRDLFRSPLMGMDVKPFDAVVFDPPRAGAEAQSRELAGSKVQRIAAVSCNPVTLARDLRILIDGGYKLTGVTPIDQFLWSPHVEAVALLER